MMRSGPAPQVGQRLGSAAEQFVVYQLSGGTLAPLLTPGSPPGGVPSFIAPVELARSPRAPAVKVLDAAGDKHIAMKEKIPETPMFKMLKFVMKSGY